MMDALILILPSLWFEIPIPALNQNIISNLFYRVATVSKAEMCLIEF